ncbi:MAG: ABC transporter permease subunit, partial [Planctomycetales bacterium]|nr:ABC transporter permease subunit [Planctomycetales bacterium]
MLPRVSPARMIRLCLKELRESLRDRRTIVTLVLMPLLVYPLLSLILNRVLLSSAANQTGTFVSIGISSELQGSALPLVLELGYALLQDREQAPVFLEEVILDKRPGPASEEEKFAPALPRPQYVLLDNSGREALRSGAIDVIIMRKSTSPDNDAEAGESQPGNILQPLIDTLRRQRHIPDDIDLQDWLNVTGSYEIRYRERDAQSERALQILERILAAVNNESIRRRLSIDFQAPFRLVATPVATKSNYADLLATMVPLVLVLMTMAGAVYPAIDLTAGERERGTMEALIVSPTPKGALLLAKYSAVVTVALLTALANLAAMTVTLWVSGIGKLVFGDGVLSAGVVGTVLVLLVLFTMFFAALLLAVTSFAKSFKEAQAYLIPLMLLALTPGVMSLLPGIQFT